MFNLFKKSKQVISSVKASFTDPNVLIAEIHNAFDSSTERLLNEAKAILAQQKDTSKGERLQKLGFGKSASAVEAFETIKDKTEKKQLADHIEYYSVHYPNYKFITENMVKDICKKYGLVCGESSYYIGDVPEKNVSAIENFKLRNEDCIIHKSEWFESKNSPHGTHFIPVGKKTANSRYGYVIWNRGWYGFYDMPEDQKDHYEKPEFQICAPVKDFDTNYMRIEDGYKLSHIPDPIVLQPVKGGYLIVTKWGLEGEDKDLVNEQMN